MKTVIDPNPSPLDTHEVNALSWALRKLQGIAPSSASRLAFIGLAFGLWLVSRSSVALPGDISTEFPVNDDNPKASIPTMEQRNEDPIAFAHFLQDLVARAEGAAREKDWQRSVKYYEAVALAVPDRAIGFSRLCLGYAKLGQIEVAAANCGKAIQLGGAKVYDHLGFIDLKLRHAELSAEEIADVEASLEHLRKHVATHPQPPPPWDKEAAKHWADKAREVAPAGNEQTQPGANAEEVKERFLKKRMDLLASKLAERRTKEAAHDQAKDTPLATLHLPTEIELSTCKLAARLNDVDRLSECMDALRGFKVNEQLIVPFAWSKALLEKDAEAAAALLESAAGLGVSEATLTTMGREHEKVFLKARILGVLKRNGLLIFGLLVAGGAAVFVARMWLGRWRKATVASQA